MHNVFSSEFYKIRHRRSILICCIIALISGFLVGVLTIPSNEPQTVITNVNAGNWYYALSGYVSSFMFIFAMILPSIVITSEFTDNTMKNILFNGSSRIHLYISKIILIEVLVVFFNVLIMTGGTLTVGFFHGFGNLSSSVIGLLASIGKMSLIMCTYICIFSLIGILIKNIIGCIALSYGVRVLEGILVIVSNNIKALSWIKKIIIGNFSFYEQRVVDTKLFINNVLVCAIIALLTLTIGIFIFNRQDIKS